MHVSHVETGNVNGTAVTYGGDEDGYSAASWETADAGYSITTRKPVKKRVIAGYVEEALEGL